MDNAVILQLCVSPDTPLLEWIMLSLYPRTGSRKRRKCVCVCLCVSFCVCVCACTFCYRLGHLGQGSGYLPTWQLTKRTLFPLDRRALTEKLHSSDYNRKIYKYFCADPVFWLWIQSVLIPVGLRHYLSEFGSADWSVADTRHRKEWKSSILHNKDLKCIETDLNVNDPKSKREVLQRGAMQLKQNGVMGRNPALPGFGCAKDFLGDSMFVAVGSDI